MAEQGPTADESLAELRYITRCACEPPYPLASGRHGHECLQEYRMEVDIVATALARRSTVTQAATDAVLAWRRATTTVDDVRRLYPWLGVAMDALAEAVEAAASDTAPDEGGERE